MVSQLSYLPMDKIVPGPNERGWIAVEELAAKYAVMQQDNPDGLSNDITVNDAISVINAIGSTPRYKDSKLFAYTNNIDLDQEKQFAAFCVIIGRRRLSRKMLVVYRGTDMTLIGWKESLNMSFITSIPSQKEAVSYLDKTARRCRYPLIIAGHSKGGNLAVYAGPLQHRLCTWEVTYNNMVDAGELTEQSRFINNIICEWINQIDESQRQQFIQAIYTILVSCNASSVADLTDDWKNTAIGIINALFNMDKPTKKLMGKIIGDLFKTAKDNFGKRNNAKHSKTARC